jgi:hypothetical protein
VENLIAVKNLRVVASLLVDSRVVLSSIELVGRLVPFEGTLTILSWLFSVSLVKYRQSTSNWNTIAYFHIVLKCILYLLSSYKSELYAAEFF